MPEGPDAQKVPISRAAAEVGVPERSLFRAVEKGRVPSTKRDGVTVVDLADVQAWAARRAAAQAVASAPATATGNPPTAAAMTGSLPAAHGGVAVGSGRTALRPVLDGETTARLIAAFKRGEGPVDVAEAQLLPIPLVLEAFDQFTRASAAAPPPFQAKLDEFQIAMEVSNADIAGLMNSITALQRSVSAIEARIANIPTPERDKFTCESCGAAGFVGVRAECTACGKPGGVWGFHPKREP